MRRFIHSVLRSTAGSPRASGADPARTDSTRRRRVLSVLLSILALLIAAPASARECADVRMPDRVNVGGTRLVLNGMGVREATVFNVDVYVAGLYVEHRSRNGQQILDADERRRLVLHLVRDVEREEMVSALRDGFRRNAGGQQSALSARVNQLARMMPELEEGDVMTFTYVPGTGLTVNVNGRSKGTIEGTDFARVFFSIWLGSQPPNPGLRSGLLGGSCG